MIDKKIDPKCRVSIFTKHTLKGPRLFQKYDGPKFTTLIIGLTKTTFNFGKGKIFLKHFTPETFFGDF